MRHRRTAIGFAGCAVCAALLVASVARAQVRGEIVGPGATRMPLAVPELRWLGGRQMPEVAGRFVAVLRADLELSGLFRVINPDAYIEDPQAAGMTLESTNFDNWAMIGALGLVRGGYYGSPAGISVEARYFDVANRSSSGGRKLSGESDTVARLAHRMADAILEFVTGLPGPFDSRLAFVSNRGGRFREVYSFTFDGRIEQETDHRSITMAPSWSPDSHSLLFTSFRGGRPVLYEIDTRTHRDLRVASKMGVNVGGAWAPDGRSLAVAREQAGNTDLYLLDPDHRSMDRLTAHWGIDVEPSWSPDGRRIAFCSSRSGTPQIYTTHVGRVDVQRITFEGDYNCSPAWSPDGRWIAFAGQRQGRFKIFVVPAAGGTPRQLTHSGSNEEPTWAPDSRYLAFSAKRGAHRKIYMIGLEGRWERQLTSGTADDSSPSWSRRLR